MGVVTIKDYVDILDGDNSNGLLLKIPYAGTTDIEKFELIGRDGKKANGTASLVNEAEFIVVGAGTYGKAVQITSGERDALAVSKYLEVVLTSALTVGAKLYIANTSAGAEGEIVSDLSTTPDDLVQEVGFVIPDKTGGATTSTSAVIYIKQGSIVPTP